MDPPAPVISTRRPPIHFARACSSRGRGLRSISSQEAVAIGLVEPILMPVWVFLVWREENAWWTVVGASFILAGLVLRYVVWEWLGRKPDGEDGGS